MSDINEKDRELFRVPLMIRGFEVVDFIVRATSRGDNTVEVEIPRECGNTIILPADIFNEKIISRMKDLEK